MRPTLVHITENSPHSQVKFVPITFSVKLVGSRTSTDGLTRSCRSKQKLFLNTSYFHKVTNQHRSRKKTWEATAYKYHLYEFQNAVGWVLSFIFVHRGTVKDHRSGICLNIILKHKETSAQQATCSSLPAHCSLEVSDLTTEHKSWWMVQSKVPNFICPASWMEAFLSSGSNARHGGHHCTQN